METFKAYARKIGLGNGSASYEARIVQRIGKGTPSGCRAELMRQYKRGAITEDEYLSRVEAVDILGDMWRGGVQTHIDPCTETSGWQSIGDGCHQRRVHIDV